MSLDPLHEWVARIAFDLPQAQEVAIAGGNAVLAHDLVVRPTQDLDLFTPVASEVDTLVTALAQALRTQGAQAPESRQGVGYGTAGAVGGQRLDVASARPAFAAMRWRSMAR